MRVIGHEAIYAVGDSVNFDGPKMGHMAVRQGEVAAANLVAEIEGREPAAHYSHEMQLIIEEPGGDSVYWHKDVWMNQELLEPVVFGVGPNMSSKSIGSFRIRERRPIELT